MNHLEKQQSGQKNVWRNSKSFVFPRISTKFIENSKASKDKTYSNNLAFVTTFNLNNKNLFSLIRTAFKSLQQSYEIKECFKGIKLIKSQRQTSSLKKLLTRAIYSSKKEHYSKK